MLPVDETDSDTPSYWLLRYAAEPRPWSAVSLNQEGSIDSCERAVGGLNISPSVADIGPGFALGDFEAPFSVASVDRGRLLEVAEPLDVGRCCHDRVPARDGGIALLGDGADAKVDLMGDCEVF